LKKTFCGCFSLFNIMKLNIFFSFFKNKSELKSEDKLQTSFAGRGSSAWSWSYDLNITERLEAAMKLAKKSHHLEIDLEDKNLELNLDKDLDDFIFHKSPQIHELTMIERIMSASQLFDKINQKIEEDYPQKSPRHLMPPTEVSVDESLNKVKRLRLSDMQNQRSWLDRITKPFPEDKKDEMKPEKVEKKQQTSQIQAVLIEYLQQFIQKTALPTIKKYEQLQKKYSNEKKEWTKKAEFLERQNYWLKSELQNVGKSYRGGAEGWLTNLEKNYSWNRQRFDVKENLLLPVPEYDDIRRSLDFDMAALVIPDVKSQVSLERECTGETEELTDFKPGYYGQVNHVELEEAVSVNKSQIYIKDFPNTKGKLEKPDTLNFQRKHNQESLQSRNTENLRADNALLESISLNSQQEPHIAQGSSPTNLDCLNPNKGTFGVKASRDYRAVQEGATAYVSDMGEWAGRKVSSETEDLCKSKVETLPKTVTFDPYLLAVSDSWYLQKKKGEACTLNNRVLKKEKERCVVLNTSKCTDSRNKYRVGNIISNNSISGNAIRSMWL